MGVYILRLRHACAAVLIIAAAGCSSLPRQPFTASEQAIAQIPGIPGARYWADAAGEDIRNAIKMPSLFVAAKRIGSLNVLALSGGSSNGAYGAGVLNGLSARNERPKYVLVTGVSAGALIAPFAFLGPDYDEALTRAWTSGLAASLGEGGILTLLFSQDSRRAALYDLVSSFVDEALLRRIAAEHRLGRRLLVVTTNLDAQRPVVWDLGTIAASGNPKALELIRNILTASASIPGAFAPTLIEVEANGTRFSELHVDGGATLQVFTIPEAILARGETAKRPLGLPIHFFVVINNRLKPEFEVVEGSTAAVLTRSLASLIKSHARATLVATQEFARDHDIDFNLTYIGDDFPPELTPSFETDYMRKVFHYGYEKAASGHSWQKQIPFINGPHLPAVAAAQR